MLALGLLFIIVAAGVTAGAIYDGGEDAQFEIFGQTIGTTVSGVFVAGIATMLLFFVGVYLLMKALARSRRKRIERKETKTRQRESVSKIEEERAQLRAENEALQEKLARDRRPDTTGENHGDHHRRDHHRRVCRCPRRDDGRPPAHRPHHPRRDGQHLHLRPAPRRDLTTELDQVDAPARALARAGGMSRPATATGTGSSTTTSTEPSGRTWQLATTAPAGPATRAAAAHG